VNALNNLVYLTGVIAVVALPFLVVNWFRYTTARMKNRTRFVPLPAKFPTKSVGFFVVPIIVSITLGEIVRWRSRAEALAFLSELPGTYIIYVDSQPAREPDKIVAALKTAAREPGHHSHPTKRIRIDIHSEKGNLTLELGRDSDRRQEYWVFYPKYLVTSDSEIGRVTTPIFDEH
jgi:hypothetical protein